MKAYRTILILVLMLCGHNDFAQSQEQGLPDQKEEQFNYLVLYVETLDSARINGFINEMESYPHKVKEVSYQQSTAEFTIIYTDLISDNTIVQIFMRYFTDFKKVSGTYVVD